eukprot:TRINITY_DN9953_c0_g2_i2.p1 TRINITY_DN9953_c0_g2~~TRINITY_DN9953_c0_g2_i2.p1  ORF type:complete len:638 (+),score=107.89 TRINITY_DN9953_c0_g2_i2:46-1959(+)
MPMTAALTAGICQLYQNISDGKIDGYRAELTADDGSFNPKPPVPVLAGRYRYVRCLGQGGFARLIEVEDLYWADKRRVAVKVMHRDYAAVGQQEAKLVQDVNAKDAQGSQRIIQCLGTFTFGPHFCLAFELLSSTPLHHCIERACQTTAAKGGNREALRKTSIAKVAVQLLKALAHLARCNVIHADIKPDNILLVNESASSCAVKLADFGNAMPATDQAVGAYYDAFDLQSPLYRAPEVMLGIPFGMEIDVWSAGCVVAELYTNVPFFSGASPPEVMESILATFPQLPQPYANGKFYGKYASKIELEDSGDLLDLDQRHARLTSAVLTRLGSRDHVFGSFVAGLLDPNPSLRLTPMDALAHPFLAHQVTVHPDRPLAWRPSRRSSWRHCQHDPDRLRQRWSLRWVPGDDARGGASPPPVTRRGKSSVSLSSGRHGSVKLQPQGMADTGSRRLSNSNGKGFVTIAQQPPSSTLAARATTIKEEPIASPLPAQQTHAQALDRHDATGISHPAEASIERSHSKLQTPSHRRDEIKDGADHDPSTAAVTNNQQTKPKTAQAKPRRKAGSRKLKTQAVKQDPNGSRPRRARQPRVSDDVRYSAQHVLQAKRAKHMSDAIDINSTDDLDDDDDDDDDDPLLIM